jgi:hypothetical protein
MKYCARRFVSGFEAEPVLEFNIDSIYSDTRLKTTARVRLDFVLCFFVFWHWR